MGVGGGKPTPWPALRCRRTPFCGETPQLPLRVRRVFRNGLRAGRGAPVAEIIPMTRHHRVAHKGDLRTNLYDDITGDYRRVGGRAAALGPTLGHRGGEPRRFASLKRSFHSLIWRLHFGEKMWI